MMLRILLSAARNLLGRSASGAHLLARKHARPEPHELGVEFVLDSLLKPVHSASTSSATRDLPIQFALLQLFLRFCDEAIELGLSLASI